MGNGGFGPGYCLSELDPDKDLREDKQSDSEEIPARHAALSKV